MNPQTVVYKQASGCFIEADVYLPEGDARDRPVILWIHGGSLMSGGRRKFVSQRADQLAAFLAASYVVVALDYRLAPEVKVGAIFEDLRDCYLWIRESGPELWGADAGRIALVGGSAGGYLALMGGCFLEPRPRSLVSFYGYGDLIGDWAVKPFYYRKTPSMRESEAIRFASGPVRTSNEGIEAERRKYVRHCREAGTWAALVTGLDPEKQQSAYQAFCPLQNLSVSFPPTLLLHGGIDDNVPYQQSVMVAVELDRLGVGNTLITIPAGVHGFDSKMREDPAVRDAWQKTMRFLNNQFREDAG
jgi:acetyl esterase/lipase